MKVENTSTSSRPASGGRAAGLTLIELMITLVIATILLTIAVPLYLHQIRESRRTEARSALLDLAAREERYFDTNNAYTGTASSLGFSGFGSANPVGNGQYYYIASPITFSNTDNPPTFKLEADPMTGKGQDQDTDCAQFFVDSKGDETAKNSAGADTSATCWQ